MSNTRHPRRKPPAEWAALAASARCSDCPGRARVRFAAGEWAVTLRHAPGCPALTIAGKMLHSDAAASVSAASERAGRRLTYEPAGDRDGIVHGGVVTSQRPT